MQTITVGKKKNVTFIPIDQDGNANPVGSDGLPLDVAGIPTWSLGELLIRTGTRTEGLTGFTLTPSADGRSCDVTADIAGTTLVLYCHADRGDGVIVHGGSVIEAVGEAGPVPVIGSLSLQFGTEQ